MIAQGLVKYTRQGAHSLMDLRLHDDLLVCRVIPIRDQLRVAPFVEVLILQGKAQ